MRRPHWEPRRHPHQCRPPWPRSLDGSIIHPGASGCIRQAAQQAGAAAAKRDQDKRALYATSDPHGYHFVPFSVESYGRLGQPALQFLNKVAAVACSNADDSELDKSTFLETAYSEISVALCRGVAHLYSRCTQNLVPLSGSRYQPGLDSATVDVSAA